MTAQTTTQRTAKHRLVVKERMARMTEALKKIEAKGDPWSAFVARIALMEPDSSNGAEEGS